MPITPWQRKKRKESLGGSDMAALFGCDPWKTEYDVWLDKTFRVEDTPTTKAMEEGSLFEPVVLDYAERLHGPLLRNQRRSAPNLPLASNIDAIVRSDGLPVEAKTVHFQSPVFAEYGDEGTHQVPEHVAVQAHAHMLCLRLKVELCLVPVLLGGTLREYTVLLNRELADMIADKADRWWHDHVVLDQAPDGVPTLGVIRRLKRIQGKLADIPAEVVAKWQKAKEARKQAEETEEQYEAEMLAALGDATVGDYGDPERLLVLQSVDMPEGTKKAHTQIRKYLKKREGAEL